MRAYPDYDIEKAKAYGGVVKDFTTGPSSKALTAYGTAINHARALYDNTGTKSYIPGTDEYKRYNQDITYVATEVAKALNPSGVATESSIKEQEDALRSVTNRKAAIENAEHILTGKMAEMKQRWANGQVRPATSLQCLRSARRRSTTQIHSQSRKNACETEPTTPGSGTASTEGPISASRPNGHDQRQTNDRFSSSS